VLFGGQFANWFLYEVMVILWKSAYSYSIKQFKFTWSLQDCSFHNT
jgi:hypothetical protein